jgi:hypothetical protein
VVAILASKQMSSRTYQKDAAIALDGAVDGLWLLGANTELLARGLLETVLRAESILADLEGRILVGLDVVRLGGDFWILEGLLGKGKTLALGLGGLNEAIGALGALATTASGGRGRTTIVNGGREHDAAMKDIVGDAECEMWADGEVGYRGRGQGREDRELAVFCLMWCVCVPCCCE